MTLQQLRYLCAVVDCGFNISRAAQVLHTSQPGISKQVGALEEELNAAIFVRRKGRVLDVSERGARILEIARRILKDANSLRHMGDEFVHGESGQLALGVLHVHARYLLLDVISQFKRAHPAVRVDLLQGTPGKVSDMVLSGEADIGVTIERLRGGPDCCRSHAARFRVASSSPQATRCCRSGSRRSRTSRVIQWSL